MADLWSILRFVAAVVAVVYGLGAVFSAVELYLVLDGSAITGQPIHVDTLAPTAGESMRSLAVCIAAVAAACGLSSFAQARQRRSVGPSFEPAPPAQVD
jgi:hypothetical protein